jgi:serine/threonine protein kinase
LVPLALDFLAQLIRFDPSQRPSAANALAHPWLNTYHDESDEPVCTRTFDRWRTIEELETLEEFREALIKEVYECRLEVRDLPIPSPELDRQTHASHAYEEVEENKRSASPPVLSRTHSRGETMPPNMSRKASLDYGAIPPRIPESETVEFPASQGYDPVVAYSRRSMLGHLSRTNSTFSIHRNVNGPPTPADAAHPAENSSSTIKFPSTEYIVPSRHRAASMYTSADDGLPQVPVDMKRLLRTLSTVSVYESGEGLAGGLADIAPIGKYIGQKDRTGDGEVHSEVPRELAETEMSETAEVPPDSGKRKGRQSRFQV